MFMRSVSPQILAFAVAALVTSSLSASSIKKDEEILFFRTGAATAAAGSKQALPVRGWVFEPERRSIWRRMLQRALVKALGLPKGSDSNRLFKARSQLFLADSESRKDVDVRFEDGASHRLTRTTKSGLTQTVLEGAGGNAPGRVRYVATLSEDDPRRFEGEIFLSAPEGMAVVSDIDDTVKVTMVNDRKEMLRNTFLRPFQIVTGMPAKYQSWAQSGAIFHYVSGSPVQLYPSLLRFLDDSGLPQGGIHLRNFWSREKQSEDPKERANHKIDTIEGLLALHPQRKFILVGDSGEHDPELYAEISRRNPGRIHKIYIRQAPLADESDARYQKAFEGLKEDTWTVFSDPHVLPSLDTEARDPR